MWVLCEKRARNSFHSLNECFYFFASLHAENFSVEYAQYFHPKREAHKTFFLCSLHAVLTMKVLKFVVSKSQRFEEWRGKIW